MSVHKPDKLFLILFLALVLIVSGCSKSTDDDGQAEISVAMTREPMTLNPLTAELLEERQLNAMIFEGLIANDDNGELIGVLAERWLVSDDRLNWTFELRQDVSWHDGQPFTAYDVEFTYNLLAFHEELAQPEIQGIVEDIQVEDEYKITFVLSRPHGPFVQSVMAPIIPRHLYDPQLYGNDEYQSPTDLHPLARAPVGTGPWVMKLWEPGDFIQLEQYDDYKRGEKPQLQTIYYRFYDDYNSAVQALLDDEIDMVPNIPALDVAQLDSALNKRFQLLETKAPEHWYLAFNFRQDVFAPVQNYWNQPQVRQAVAWALNRDNLVQQAVDGFGTVVNAPIMPGSWASTGETGLSYSPDEASALLLEGGWDFSSAKDPEIRAQNLGSEALPIWSRLEFTLTYANDLQPAPALAEAIIMDLEAVGFKVNPNPQPWAIVLNEHAYRGSFHMVLLKGDLTQEPDPYSLLASGQAENFGGFSCPRMDDILDSGRSTINRDIRAQIYRDIEQELSRELPILPLFVPHTVTFARKDLQVKPAVIGLSDAKNWYLIK